MTAASDIAAAALAEMDRLRSSLKKKKTPQVRSAEEQALVKATAQTWFKSHRAKFPNGLADSQLKSADTLYRKLLDAGDRHTARSTYASVTKQLREALIALRSITLATPISTATSTSDQVPDFSPLANPDMQAILVGRWNECIRCIGASAPLAATVMMGGLLETLLLSRINIEAAKAPIYTAAAAPKDKKSGTTLTLNHWGLSDFIAVAHELRWISVSTKEVASVLRNFRNYIHPNKQLSEAVTLTDDDAHLFWEISKTITRQLLKNSKP